MSRLVVIDKCGGCKKIDKDNTCSVYASPMGKWSIGGCHLHTNIKRIEKGSDRKINPIKASKRGLSQGSILP